MMGFPSPHQRLPPFRNLFRHLLTTTRYASAKIDELSGLSVFYKGAKGDGFHTYSTYARGDALVDGTYMLVDMTPKGRNETGPPL